MILFNLLPGMMTLLVLATAGSTDAFMAPPEAFVESVLNKTAGQSYCSLAGQIGDSCCDFETVEEISNTIHPQLSELVKTPFFSHYKINLYKGCPFWPDNMACNNQACSVTTIDESQVPEAWRSDHLGAVDFSAQPKGIFDIPKQCSVPEKDFCFLEDSSSGDGAYVNLQNNPERFTGYAGFGARQIWKTIYEENCFDLVDDLETSSTPTDADADAVAETFHPGARTPDHSEENLEKRVFYRIISGLHASISVHICDEYFYQDRGEWGPNLDCFVSRIGRFPERLQNIYFNYVLLLRAITKLSPYMGRYDFCTGDFMEEQKIRDLVEQIVSTSLACPSTFDEKAMFTSPNALHLKNEFKDHFRNISRIMDCVGCEKCRLWGKMQITGVGTALKILFSYEDASFVSPTQAHNILQQTEIVALFNTFARFSESLRAVERFRTMYQERSQRFREEEEWIREHPLEHALSQGWAQLQRWFRRQWLSLKDEL